MDLFRIERYDDWANPSWYADGIKLQSSTKKTREPHPASPTSPLLVDYHKKCDEAKRIAKQLKIK